MMNKRLGWVSFDGKSWQIYFPDSSQEILLARFRQVMGLPGIPIRSGESPFSTNLVSPSVRCESLQPGDSDTPPHNPDYLPEQLARLSIILVRMAQAERGVLLHASLLEWHGMGFLLAGPGGIGKSTAAQRLPAEWKTWSDDACLVLPGESGGYLAHPWPTWSRFFYSGPGGSWEVNRTLPLRAICFLGRAENDRLEKMESGKALGELVEVAEQISWVLNEKASRREQSLDRAQRFENLCALAQQVPAYSLVLSRSGAYWKLLEQLV